MKVIFVILAFIGTCCGVAIPDELHKVMENVMHKYVKMGLKFHKPEDNPFPSESPCECINYDCGCCVHLDIPKLHINDQGCVNVTYLPDQYGVSFTFSIDGKVYYNETVSARNPPPICFGLPHLEKEASLCVDFYNINYSASNFGGCITLEARLYHVLVQDVDLGCFHMPLSMKHWSMFKAKGLWSKAKEGSEDNKTGPIDGDENVVEKVKNDVKNVANSGKRMIKTLETEKEKIQKILDKRFKLNIL